MAKKGLFLGTCLLLIIGLLGVFHMTALADPEATITIDPTEGSAGTVVTILGSGFASDSTIDVTWNGEAIATDPETVTTGGDGSFSCEIAVVVDTSNPLNPSYGEFLVAATDGTNSDEATFYVIPSKGDKVVAGIKQNIIAWITLPFIINNIANEFFDLGHLRLTERGNEFVDNMVLVISDGAKYAAQWLTEKLGG